MLAALLFSLGLIALATSRSLRRARLRYEAWTSLAARAEGTIRVPTEYFDLSLRQYRKIEEADDPPPAKAVFKAGDGHEYAITAGYRFEEGQKVKVLYDPESPSTATLDTGPPSRFGEVFARVFGGLLFAGAFAAFWMNR